MWCSERDIVLGIHGYCRRRIGEDGERGRNEDLQDLRVTS